MSRISIAEEKSLLDHYISYLAHCFVCGERGECGWYRDLKRRDRIGNVATAQVVLTYAGANKDIPKNDEVFQQLYDRRLSDGSWPFVSNIDHVGVVDSTAWVLQALLIKQSPFCSVMESLSNSFTWLIQSQNEDGGWGLVRNSESRVVSTSFALRALCSANTEQYRSYINNGISFLLDHQDIDHFWASASSKPCVAATSHSILTLRCFSDPRITLPVNRAVQWLLSSCILKDDVFFDDFSAIEEVETKVEGRIIRLHYSYPITPLAIRVLLTSLPLENQVEKIYNGYIEALSRGKVFRGAQTAQGHETSYGVHDIVWSILAHNPETNKTAESETYSVETINQLISNAELPQLFAVTKPNKTKEFNCSVVFIHGLSGHATSTWLNEKSNCFLPSIIAKNLLGTRVYTIGYENSSSYWSGNAMSLYDRTANIIKLLEISDIVRGNIILIGHSFGGLLIKSILCGIQSFELGDSPARRLLEKIKGVCFIATPHHGSKLADFAKSLSMVFRASASTKDLVWNNNELKRLNAQYKTLATNLGIKHLSFSETKHTAGVMVVNSESADIGLPGAGVVPIDGNHIEIAKPSEPQSLLAKSIIKWAGDLSS